MKIQTRYFALLLLLLAACSTPGAQYQLEERIEGAPAQEVTYDDAALKLTNSPAQAPVAPPEQQQLRKLIYRANLHIEVEHHQTAYASIKRQVALAGGYIADASQQDHTYSIERALTIRVPVTRFDSVLSAAEGLATKIHSRRVYTEDVSEEWVDIEVRLKNKYAVESRYRALLQQAKSIKDILEVEEKLRVIREEIEVQEGRMRYLKDQVAMSTIYLSLTETIPYEYQPTERASFWEQLLDSIDDGWGGFLSFMIFTVKLWPFVLTLTVAGWLLLRWRRLRRQKAAH